MINLLHDSLADLRPVTGDQDGELMEHAMPEPGPALQVRR